MCVGERKQSGGDGKHGRVPYTNAASATFWSAADILLRQGAQFCVSIILARLLSPAEFGTVALIYLFTEVAAIPAGTVMSMSLIQDRAATYDDECTVFWFNIGAAFVAALALSLSGFFIASFFEAPELAPLSAVMGLSIIAIAPGSIHNALFTKRLDFRPLMRAGLLSVLASGTVAIAMAHAGFGPWALAAQALVYSATATISLWLLSSWRPALVFRISSLQRSLRFSGYMMASVLLSLAAGRLYAPIVGRLYGMRELGLYSRGEATAQLPAVLLHSIIERVNFPLFSKLSDNRDQLRESMRIAVQSVIVVTAPMMLGLAAVARPAVLTLFGEQWLPSVPILRLLCCSGLLLPLHGINLQGLMGLGQSRLVFKIELIKKSLGVVLLAAGAFNGALGVACAIFITSMLTLPVSAHFSGLLLDYGVCSQIWDALPAIGAAAIMDCTVLLLSMSTSSLTPAFELMVLTLFGAVIYLALAFLLKLPFSARCAQFVRKIYPQNA